MRYTLITAALMAGLAASGCAIVPTRDHASRGAMLGAGAGAVIGHQYGDGGRDKGALIGGVLGYTAGLFYEQKEREIDAANRRDAYNPPRNSENAYYGHPRRHGGYYSSQQDEDAYYMNRR